MDIYCQNLGGILSIFKLLSLKILIIKHIVNKKRKINDVAI